MPTNIILAGRRFGRLLVLEKAPQFSWKCLCDCGSEKTVKTGSLIEGKTNSCGCLRREITGERARTHGMRRTKLYGVWYAMIERCYSVKSKDFHNYGGRGIKVCEFLKASVVNLAQILGTKPTLTHTLHRVNNDAGYFCGICAECLTLERKCNIQWATVKVQARNKRNNHFMTVGVETKTLAEWSEHTGINYSTLRDRVRHGKDPFKLCP